MMCLPVFVFVSEDQISQPPTVTVEVVTERKSAYLCLVVNWTVTIMMLSMPGEKKKDRFGAFDEVCFYVSNLCRKHFL
jgi:hypothetical protein